MIQRRVTKDADGIRRYTDSLGRVWVITQYSLPMKRGERKYWGGDSVDGKHSKYSNKRSDLISQIDLVV